MRQRKNITIKDAYGEDHHYFMIQLPSRKGMRLFNRLMLMGSSAAGILTQDAAGIEISEALGAALKGIVSAVVSNGDDKFWQRLLEDVTRDGQALVGSHLADAEFDKAYQGNYSELFKAIYAALDHNFGASLKDLLGNLPSVIQGAQGMAAKVQGQSGS